MPEEIIERKTAARFIKSRFDFRHYATLMDVTLSKTILDSRLADDL